MLEPYEGNPRSSATWQGEAVSGPAPGGGLSLDAMACATATRCLVAGNALALGTLG